MEVVHIDMVGSESPCRAELLSLFFQVHPRWRFFIIIFIKNHHIDLNWLYRQIPPTGILIPLFRNSDTLYLAVYL